MRTRSSIGLLVATALLHPGFAAAQEEPRPDADTPRFESSVEVEAAPTAVPATSSVATRMPVLPRDLPLSVAVVGRALLDEQAALVLGDALENVSGVNVATGFGVFDFFVIRGFDSLSSGLVLTDGLPEPESTFYPLYNVRQVEVLKGPASFLLGGNPLAGAVQLDRKQPQAKTFADVTLGYGRYGTFEAALDANAATARREAVRARERHVAGDGRVPGPPRRLDPGPEPHPHLAARLEDPALPRLRDREERVAARHRHPVRRGVGRRISPRSRGPRPTRRPTTPRRRTSSASASRRRGASAARSSCATGCTTPSSSGTRTGRW